MFQESLLPALKAHFLHVRFFQHTTKRGALRAILVENKTFKKARHYADVKAALQAIVGKKLTQMRVSPSLLRPALLPLSLPPPHAPAPLAPTPSHSHRLSLMPPLTPAPLNPAPLTPTASHSCPTSN